MNSVSFFFHRDDLELLNSVLLTAFFDPLAGLEHGYRIDSPLPKPEAVRARQTKIVRMIRRVDMEMSKFERADSIAGRSRETTHVVGDYDELIAMAPVPPER
jgi:hypothetical protein